MAANFTRSSRYRPTSANPTKFAAKVENALNHLATIFLDWSEYPSAWLTESEAEIVKVGILRKNTSRGGDNEFIGREWFGSDNPSKKARDLCEKYRVFSKEEMKNAARTLRQLKTND